LNPLVSGLAALIIATCGGTDDGGLQEGASDSTADTLVVTRDPELRAVASEILPDLARRSGLGLRAPVRLERRSREALERYLVSKLDEELPPERAARLTRAYGLLGLVPQEMDLRELLLAVYSEQVAGFYDPDSTALFVLDDQPTETLRPLLLHELVHAVQDQWADLEALTAPEAGNDRRTAAQAAIEGHATLVMLEYMTEQIRGESVDLADVPDMAAQLRPALEAVRTQYPALASAPRVIQEGLLLPYLEGAGFVLRLWQDRPERVAPFGDELPTSTEQVLDPGRFLADPRDEPTEVAVEPAAGTILLDDVLGQAEVRILLDEWTGADDARGWDGDRWILVEPPGGGDAWLAWVSVWDTPADRDRVRAQLSGALGGRPAPTSLEALEIEGRPALVLRLAGGEGVELAITLEAGAP
jgi:hypothetical protein